MWLFARPADGEHCPASSLKASGIQPANPVPAVGSGLWRACAAIHCQWSSEECGGQIQCFPAHHTESSGKNSLEEVPQVYWQVIHRGLFGYCPFWLVCSLGQHNENWFRVRVSLQLWSQQYLSTDDVYFLVPFFWNSSVINCQQRTVPIQSFQHGFRILQQGSWKYSLLSPFIWSIHHMWRVWTWNRSLSHNVFQLSQWVLQQCQKMCRLQQTFTYSLRGSQDKVCALWTEEGPEGITALEKVAKWNGNFQMGRKGRGQKTLTHQDERECVSSEYFMKIRLEFNG